MRWSGWTVGIVVVSGLLLVGSSAASPYPIRRQTSNVSVTAHVDYQDPRGLNGGTDLQLQRREGFQTVDGATDSGTRDFVFAGTHRYTSNTRGTIEVIDVTDPADPVVLESIRCPGYHADVAVHENLLLQAIDSASTNPGCRPSWLERSGSSAGDDGAGVGVRIFDVTDPARPELLDFVHTPSGVHNLTVVPWAGLAYLAYDDPALPSGNLGIIDLGGSTFPLTDVPMRDISPGVTVECHDIGLDPDRQLAFCAAIDATFVWDIGDPYAPAEVATIVNPAINLHHGARPAPDGKTLVLNDELGGAAVAPGCQGTGSIGGLGALWFYDVSDPSSPTPLGSFSPTERNPTQLQCTSHFYNFVPGEDLVSVGWYRAGAILADFSDPARPAERAAFAPYDASFWSSYYWHGHLYGNAFDWNGGLWILEVEGLPDVAPAPQDEGTSWGRWTGP